MKNLIEYMPPFLKNVREFNKIFDAEDIELEKINTNMNLLLTEVIVNEATGFGLDRYESIYGITNTSNNIVVRRATILTKINDRTPYTYKWLYLLLTEIFGEDEFEINIDYNNYIIEIIVKGIHSEVMDAIIQELYYKLPANLTRNFGMSTQSDYIIGSAMVQKETNKLIVDTSIIEETKSASNLIYTGIALSHLDSNTIIIDNSIIESKSNIIQDEYIGSVMVQKEQTNIIIDNTTRFTPSYTDDVLLNPGKGFVLSTREYSTDTSYDDVISVIYYRFNWCAIEPEEGEYDWDLIDEKIEDAKERREKICFWCYVFKYIKQNYNIYNSKMGIR